MPAQPTWFRRLDEIVAALEAQPEPWVDRAALEALLEVGPRRAQQILAPCVTRKMGGERASRPGHTHHIPTPGGG